MGTQASEAVDLFCGGCACSQAVLAAFSKDLGLDRGCAMQISAGFAGGMRLGETCGAVTGAFMVLGLRHPSEACATAEARAPLYGRVLEFAEKFRQRNASLLCRDLLGCDISTPEEMKEAKDRGVFRTICVKAVRDAGEVLEEMTD